MQMTRVKKSLIHWQILAQEALHSRAYKWGRGHAPCIHDMAWQNSNQPAGYA